MRSNSNTQSRLRSTSSSPGGLSVLDQPYVETTFSVINGELAGDFVTPTPISFVKTTHRWNSLSLRSYGFNAWNPTSVSVSGPSDFDVRTEPLFGLVPTLDPGQVSDRVMEKIYEQLRGQANLSETFLEFRQTKKLLQSSLNLLTFFETFLDKVTKSRGFRSLKVRSSFSKGAYVTPQAARRGKDIRFVDRKIRVQKARVEKETLDQRRLDYVTEQWLSYRYGWVPLVNDIYNILKAMNDFTSNRTLKVKARSSLTLPHNGYRRQDTSGALWSEFTDTWIAWKKEYRIERVFTFQLPNSLQLYDFTSLNPSLIAWNALPLSFVVDWVVNVGQTLALYENYVIYSNRFVSGYETVTTREDAFVTKSLFRQDVQSEPDVSRSSFTRELSKNASSSYTQKTKTRTKLFSLPTPAGIRVQVEMNSKRLLDSAALMHQLIARKLR